MHQLLESENYGERKGAAYGLAGLVKGMGILVLKQLDIMSTLTTAIQNKKNYRHREGILIGIVRGQVCMFFYLKCTCYWPVITDQLVSLYT